MKGYTEHRFSTMAQAKAKQKIMKKSYGYSPTVFTLKHPKKQVKKRFVVIQPKGLKKV